MNPGNETCCFNHEGVKEITYRNTAKIPTAAGEWKTYYQDAGYSVPTTTTHRSTSTLLASKDISKTSASNPSAVHSQGLEISPSPANETGSTAAPRPVPATTSAAPKPVPVSTSRTTISAGVKAIIGIASALGLFGTVGSLYLFQKLRAERRAHHHSIQNRNALLIREDGLRYNALSEKDAKGPPSKMDASRALSEKAAKGPPSVKSTKGPPSEMDATWTPSEMAATSAPFEMDATDR